MAIYPLIDGPCPFQDRLTEIMDGDTCTMCQRQVHDLTSMSDNQRRAFLKSCRGEVCVSYRLSATAAAALSALAAAAAAPAALAQQPPDIAVRADREDVVVVTGGRIASPLEVDLVAVVHINANGEEIPQFPADPDPALKAYPSTTPRDAGKGAKPAGDAP